jgi:predicted transcriptional regulator
MLLISTLLMLYLGPNTVMNIDRSRSFYVLSWVGNGDIQISNGQLNLSKVISDEKLNISAIKERIGEQVDRGLIERRRTTYILTQKGKVTLSIANRLASFYHLEGWFNNRN